MFARVVFDQNGIPIGTIIAYINSKPINSSKDIDQAFYQLKEESYKSLQLHLMDQGDI
jgi:S1-C subfamily serine protease